MLNEFLRLNNILNFDGPSGLKNEKITSEAAQRTSGAMLRAAQGNAFSY